MNKFWGAHCVTVLWDATVLIKQVDVDVVLAQYQATSKGFGE